MGASVSTNVANQVVSNTVQILNKYNQNCSSASTSHQTIDLSGCQGSVISGISNMSNTVVNTHCLQDSNTQTQISADVSQQTNQAAMSVVQNFGLPAASVASNITSTITNLAVGVNNTYSQDCSASANANQNITCTNSPGVVITNINNNATVQNISDCTATNSTTTTNASNVAQAVSQTAVAKEENAFNAFFAIAFVVLIIFLLIFFYNGNSS